MKSLWLALAAPIVLVVPAAASAQVYMPTFDNSTLLLDVYSYSYPSAKTRAPDRAARSAAKPAVTARTPAEPNTAYRPSPAVTRRVQERFIAFIGQHAGKAGEREMARVLAEQDPTSSWLNVVGGDGLVANDLVDAITAYWVLNWNVANRTDNNRAQMQGARSQVLSAVAGNPALARLDENARQELAEALILNFLVQHAAFRDAMQAGDQEMMRKLSDAAVTRFRNEARLDLRAVKLTSDGFVG